MHQAGDCPTSANVILAVPLHLLGHQTLLTDLAIHQARLGGLVVKKRRSGALKFPTPSTEQHSTTQGTERSTPSARGSRQTSLLDFCTDTSSRTAAVASGEEVLPKPPSLSPSTPTQRKQQQGILATEEQGVDNMDVAEDDRIAVAPKATIPVVGNSPCTAVSPATPRKSATPGRPLPPSPSNSFGLLGGGAIAALVEHGGGGPSPAKSGGGGGGEIGGGGGHHKHAVYSDRFIPARSGSIMERGSPFLAVSPSKITGKNSTSGQNCSGASGGGRSRSSGGVGNGRRGSAGADPGGVRGTEGIAGQGAAGGAGSAGASGGGAGSAVGSPEYWPYGSSATDAQREGQSMLNMLLRSELLGGDLSTSSPARADQHSGGGLTDAGRRGGGGGGAASSGGLNALSPSPNVFRFKVSQVMFV